jgi:hypothetical protein
VAAPDDQLRRLRAIQRRIELRLGGSKRRRRHDRQRNAEVFGDRFHPRLGMVLRDDREQGERRLPVLEDGVHKADAAAQSARECFADVETCLGEQVPGVRRGLVRFEAEGWVAEGDPGGQVARASCCHVPVGRLVRLAGA